jgi:hypothetical protein
LSDGPATNGRAAFATGLHRRQVIGLQLEAAVRGQPIDHAEFGLGLDQRKRGQHHFLAGRCEFLGQRNPLGGA